jgi:hypothetical protein
MASNAAVDLVGLTCAKRASKTAHHYAQRAKREAFDAALDKADDHSDVIEAWLAHCDILSGCTFAASNGDYEAAFALCECSNPNGCIMCQATDQGARLVVYVQTLLAKRGLAYCDVECTPHRCSNGSWSEFARAYSHDLYGQATWIIVSWRKQLFAAKHTAC